MKGHNCIKYIFVRLKCLETQQQRYQAYAGPIENAVKDILRNYLNLKNHYTFEPTSTNAKYVIPNLRPYDAINFLCNTQ